MDFREYELREYSSSSKPPPSAKLDCKKVEEKEDDKFLVKLNLN